MEAKKEVIKEITRGSRKNYPRRKVVVKSINDVWFTDLIILPAYRKQNDGYTNICVILDGMSRYARCAALKTKNSKEVAQAFEKIFKTGVKPKNIQSDHGKEYSGAFDLLCKQYGVNHYRSFSTIHVSIAERFNRTLMSLLWKQFHLQGTHRWLDILQQTVDGYNNRIHRTLGLTPASVKQSDEAMLIKKMYKSDLPRPVLKPKFKINDVVRISRLKAQFEKHYYSNFSTELFKIIKVKNTIPVTYLLSDLNNQPIAGAFYTQELLKTKHKDIYLVEKVIKYSKDKKKAFIKWLGFDDSHNSWIEVNKIL
jgi:hypothetical protein